MLLTKRAFSSSSSSSSSSSDEAEDFVVNQVILLLINQCNHIRHIIQNHISPVVKTIKDNRSYYERNKEMCHDTLCKEYYSFRRRFRKRQHVSQVSQPYPLQIQSMADATFNKIQIQRGDVIFDAYVVGKENAPGIVVLQNWWGVDNEVKNFAVKISQLEPGFKALIPDLYHGKVVSDTREAQRLMEGLDWQAALEDIKASVIWLKTNGSEKVGVCGYFTGGALAIASAVHIPGVDAVVSFYGIPSPEFANAAHAKVPVQAHFGELDTFTGFSYVKVAKEMEEKLKASGVVSETHIYTGSPHAFMDMSAQAIERRKALGTDDVNDDNVQLAWSRFHSWMATYLAHVD